MHQGKLRQMTVETLESRTLMSAAAGPSTFVYVETNNPTKGKNAILGYQENTATGVLTALPTPSYPTGGTGYRNAGSLLGPDDSDKEVIASPDGKFLFAVNQGSNSISVFNIASDGGLTLVPGAPFNSGGEQPVSLTFSDDRLHVANRGNSAEGKGGTVAPSIASFTVGEDGRLLIIPHSTIHLPLNLSTAQVLDSADGKFAFVDNFATPSNLKVPLANTLEPFFINSDGTLKAVPKGSATLPVNPPLLLGLVEDPIHHILYSGIAPSGGVATYSYNDTTGKVSYVGQVESQGKGTCWLAISPDGKYLYGTDSGTDEVSVYSLANPYKPVLVQEFQLNGPTSGPSSTNLQTVDFQLSFDSTGKYLYIVNHATADSFQQGNQLHTLSVGANGKLSEPAKSPTFFSSELVPGTAHAFGLAVVTEPAGSQYANASPFGG